LWPVAERAVAHGFLPNTISTDLHKGSMNIQQANMPNVMSKMMLLGMSFEDVLLRSTMNPAKEIGRFPELGTLGPGKAADIAVLEEQTGVFAFKDSWPAKRLGTKRLECVLTVRDGNVVYERPRSAPVTTIDTQIYDLLIKHGRWAGPADNREEELDVAVVGGRIARIGRRLPAGHARVVIEAEGYDLRHASGDTRPCGAIDAGRNELAAGQTADLALLESVTGELQCVFGVRGGRIVWDSEGLSITDVSRAGPYSHFK
jgi:predicted amidohydrolase